MVVLDNPPLNLFDVATFNALENTAAELVALTDPSYAGRARAVLVEARGKVVSGGVDVSFFQAIAEGIGDDITIYSIAILIGDTLVAPLLAIASAVMYLELRAHKGGAAVVAPDGTPPDQGPQGPQVL